MTSRGLGPRPTKIVFSTLTALAVGAGCLATGLASPAAAAPAGCVSAYPQGDLAPGQEVTGLTVSRGTEPEGFDGTVVGVLEDGIAPGVDMILAELTSPAIDDNGIWAGMSGSPVYADAGRTQLIGAVSYGLSEGSTPLAGITPAADMLDLRAGSVAQRARVTGQLAARVAGATSATRAQLGSGLRPLPTPMSVSGLSDRRFSQMAGWLDDHGPVTRAATAGASADADVRDVVPGGNVAASLGWGFVSAAATGTVTDVCDGDVLAFGHPFNYAGDATYALHPAEAVAIVPGLLSAFKVANLAVPAGTFTTDRLAGLRGSLGAAPTSYDVTSTATHGSRTVTGTTHVSVPDLVADAGLANAFAASDRALDRTGKGTATASWTITGQRRNGSPFTLQHRDVYASSHDVASAPVADLAMQLYTLLENSTEAVTITGLQTSTTLVDDATRWRIGRTYWRHQGKWKRITGRSPAVIKAHRSTPIRVELYSRDADTRYVTVPVIANRKSVGRVGALTLSGGFSSEEDWFFYDSSEEFSEEYEDDMIGGTKPAGIPAVLEQLRADQKNDTVKTSFTVRGTKTRGRSISLGKVVSGFAAVPVAVRR